MRTALLDGTQVELSGYILIHVGGPSGSKPHSKSRLQRPLRRRQLRRSLLSGFRSKLKLQAALQRSRTAMSSS